MYEVGHVWRLELDQGWSGLCLTGGEEGMTKDIWGPRESLGRSALSGHLTYVTGGVLSKGRTFQVL